jgi:hypothetical protein
MERVVEPVGDGGRAGEPGELYGSAASRGW